jgi:flagellar hook assembly protein FlgD
LYPNPANNTVTLGVTTTEPGRARVDIYDVKGRLVRSLEPGELAPGAHLIQWNRHDRGGHRVPSGVYFVRVEHGATVVTRKLVLVN